MKKYLVTAALAATMMASPALADTTTTVTTLDGSQGFTAPAGELAAGSSATITNSGLELTGNRTRVLNGDNYGATTNLGSLSTAVSLTGDYTVANAGTGGVQSPAFRVYVQDGAQRSELIYEGAYNGQTGSVTAASLFWQFIAGQGATPGSTYGYTMYTLADWATHYTPNAFITAIGVGQGGGAGASFDATVSDIALNTTAGSTRYNFGSTAAVPEPATWAMMLIGFAGMGVAMRRKRARTLAQVA